MEPLEVALPTFAVLARFREEAASPEDAVRGLVARLRAADEPVHEVDVEREEGPGTWMVVARFVLVSVDAGTAVEGLSAALGDAGLEPDEVWSAGQVS